MAKNISRFIQISDAVLLEYCINKDYDGITLDDTETIKISSNDKILKLLTNELLYVNNDYINNLAIPLSNKGIEYFNTSNKTPISYNDYAKAYKTISGIDILDNTASCIIESIPYDTIKLHISTGYAFDKSYGFHIKVYVKSNNDVQENAVLLDYSYNKSFSKFNYSIEPIYFSNRVYDKYIELQIPSINYLSLNTTSTLGSILNIKNQLNNINICYNDLYEENYTEYDLDAINSTIYNSSDKLKINCGEFNIESKNATSIPLTAVSDNYGINISESTTGDYIEYYSTWKGEPLNSNIVSKFNTIIPLYNLSKTTFNKRYEESGLTSTDMWYVSHNVKVYLSCGDEQYLLDDITNTQFFKESNGTKFYYKPIPARINELGISVTDIDSIVFRYKASLINAVDGTGTQIMREGSLAVNPTKYIINTADKLSISDKFDYTIYNKIIKNNQILESNKETSKIKYTKVFYNSNNINLKDNTGTFILSLGNSPKNYKFVFTQTDSDNATQYVNFSNSYYKLYSRDINGADIYVDATYSENMNPILGELEFYIPISIIKKLKAVPNTSRFLSIVAINQDNTISSVYEFTYE